MVVLQSRQAIFFRYPIWNVPWNCVNLYYMNSRQKAWNLIILTKWWFFLTHFPLGEENTKSWCIKVPSTCFCRRSFFSLTEIFICGRKNLVTETFFLCYKLFFCDRNLFLWQKLRQKQVSVMETTGFLKKKTFLWQKKFSDLFLWQKFVSVKEICFLSVTCFCDKN